MTTFSELLSAESFEEKVESKLEEIALSFQLAIQDRMQASGIKKSELADLMGVSAARVSQLLAGRGSNLTLKSIAKAAAALDFDLEALDRSKYLALLKQAPSTQFESKSAATLVRSVSFWKDHTANKNKHPEALAA